MSSTEKNVVICFCSKKGLVCGYSVQKQGLLYDILQIQYKFVTSFLHILEQNLKPEVELVVSKKPRKKRLAKSSQY